MSTDSYIAGIDNSTESIISFINGCTEEKLNLRPVGKWSIADNLEHIILLERIVFVVLQRPQTNKSGETELYGYGKLEKILIEGRTVNKVAAPDNVQPKGKYKNISEAKDAFVVQREKLKQLIREGRLPELNSIVPHPYLGEMTVADWLNLVPLHSLRHLDQMRELLL
ncbi:MAG: DinB family protein [Ignavibacteriaceae bacterium]|nr:DinB family protein [Ignavibacteriaceae bacterium]